MTASKTNLVKAADHRSSDVARPGCCALAALQDSPATGHPDVEGPTLLADQGRAAVTNFAVAGVHWAYDQEVRPQGI